jgi:hypothetical protein
MTNIKMSNQNILSLTFVYTFKKLFAHADPPALKTKSKKKARFFGCGLPLPKIFSKRFKSKGASKCSDLTPRPGEIFFSYEYS